MPFDGVGFVPSDALQKMDAVIDLLATPEKWCKGALRSYDGRFCIRGAIRAVAGADLLEPRILLAIDEVAGKRFRRIEAFNDHPSTSHAQVLAVLTRARDSFAEGTGGAVVRPPAKPASGWRTRLFDWLHC